MRRPQGAIHKGRPADPGRGDLRNPDVQLLFECGSIVLAGRRGEGGLEILFVAGHLCEWPLSETLLFVHQKVSTIKRCLLFLSGFSIRL